MGSVSGCLVARCKECKCKYSWYIGDGWPFVDSEMVGTCDMCIDEESHDCFDENSLNENGTFEIVGRKEFGNERKNK